MSALLSSEERAEMHQGVIEQRTLAIQPYLEKYADPNIEFETKVVWHSNEAEAITHEVEKMNMILSSSIRKKKKVLPP